ncbi:MAG: hypothetical protein OXU74_06575 [Gemmatimonadota bacterium]|nr:hypothetical protein [Gemmatimonadota bacterium]
MKSDHPIYEAARADARRRADDPHFRAVSVSLTDTAKLVRAALKRKFPDVRFSVRCDRYSGGSSIDVRWTNGPRERDVDAVIGVYAGQGFDGMTDSRYYNGAWLHEDGSASVRRTGSNATADRLQKVATLDRDAVPVSFGPSFVQSHRTVSAERWSAAIKAYGEKMGDALGDAIRAGTVAKVCDACHIRVEPGWGDMALRRFEAEMAT